ncbi:hypothetical protein E2C01_056145 [Portunus trituberculatus]|uniref:Uncharacterized protein n=1 Tax=Portunus trituberculatus TaxID=210409 RepID=A0A5B7GXD5_PORTR|nr:hypothetical protein [Portunus trituberculatus]
MFAQLWPKLLPPPNCRSSPSYTLADGRLLLLLPFAPALLANVAWSSSGRHSNREGRLAEWTRLRVITAGKLPLPSVPKAHQLTFSVSY